MMKKHFSFALLCAALFAGAASALDVTDVKNLVANNVDEAVIISMVQSSGSFSATAGDIEDLRNLGASESVLAAIGSATPATGEYVLEDGTTAVIPQAAAPGTVYYAAPPAAVAPPTVYYVVPRTYPRRSFYRRPRAGVHFSFGFGDRPRYRSYDRRWR
jgi:hypothetical protein